VRCLVKPVQKSWIRRFFSDSVQKSFRSKFDSVTSKDSRIKLGKEPSYLLSLLILTKHYPTVTRNKSSVPIKQNRYGTMPHNNLIHTSPQLLSNNYIVLCRPKLTSLTSKREAKSLKIGWTSNSKAKAQFFKVGTKRIYWLRNVSNSSLKWSRLYRPRWKKKQGRRRRKNSVYNKKKWEKSSALGEISTCVRTK